ncbi:penicillin-insensitive murein endopeptidase [Aestuariivirga sp.]|uniref:penicillin-insensitive murein endopeptidase n=1 Tax=Aestuariivirga sp. TaxID=2650926 RepID=UPI003BAB1A42
MFRHVLLAVALATATAGMGVAWSQSASDMRGLAAMTDKELMKLPAKKVFGSIKSPTTTMKPRAIGFYAKGCMAGGTALPINGPAWQVMRLTRNRNWGQPQLVALVERLATEAKAKDGWNGLLVGDMSMPRGGPMPSGHASHQVGLDADVWLTPMPDRILTAKEREEIQATVVVKDRKTIDKSVWTEAHMRLLKRAASYPEVERIFVHPPIKAELCKWATGDRSWLSKVRPYYGHNYHFHIRIGCPQGSPTCKSQPEPHPKDGTGCGEELSYWLGNAPWQRIDHPPPPPTKPVKPAPPLTLASLPAECRAVVTAE